MKKYLYTNIIHTATVCMILLTVVACTEEDFAGQNSTGKNMNFAISVADGTDNAIGTRATDATDETFTVQPFEGSGYYLFSIEKDGISDRPAFGNKALATRGTPIDNSADLAKYYNGFGLYIFKQNNTGNYDNNLYIDNGRVSNLTASADGNSWTTRRNGNGNETFSVACNFYPNTGADALPFDNASNRNGMCGYAIRLVHG